MPTAWRSKATSLLNDYPPLARLQQTDADGLTALQDEFVRVLSEARWFFMRVRSHPSSTNQRRYGLTVVLRHFA